MSLLSVRLSGVIQLTPNDSDDLDFLPVLVSLPAEQTVFEYLVGAWKRLNATRSALLKKVRLSGFRSSSF